MLRRAFLKLIGISPVALISSDTTANTEQLLPGDIVFFREWKERLRILDEMYFPNTRSIIKETKGIGELVKIYRRDNTEEILYVVKFRKKFVNKYLTHTIYSLKREQLQLIKFGDNGLQQRSEKHVDEDFKVDEIAIAEMYRCNDATGCHRWVNEKVKIGGIDRCYKKNQKGELIEDKIFWVKAVAGLNLPNGHYYAKGKSKLTKIT